MTHRRVTSRAIALATAGAIVALSATTIAQRRRADNSSQGVPVATNTIAQNPDAYLGKLVTISAGVEEMLSKTTFVVDQRKMAGPGKVTSVGSPILVIAPYLSAAVTPSQYLLMRGEVVKLEPAALTRLAAGYALDLPPDLSAKYMGQPVLVVNSVVDVRSKEIGRKPIPELTPDEVAVRAAMKVISPTFTALRTAANASDAAAVAQNAALLEPAYTQTETTWDAVGQKAAAQWARDSRALAASISRAAAAGNWDEAKASVGAVNQLCQNCHGAYRERREDGSFAFKPGSF
jgi:cytochrome c556